MGDMVVNGHNNNFLSIKIGPASRGIKDNGINNKFNHCVQLNGGP